MSSNQNARQTIPEVAPMFTERWSPRSFKKQAISQQVLTRIMEAARWAPSCFNAQPWRIHTSTDATFNDYLDLLMEGNQVWAKNASVIGFFTAETHFEHNGKPNKFNAFDSGAAWMSLTLQANKEGLYTHGMGGIKSDEVAKYLELDADKEQVLMGFVIGYKDDPEKLPEDMQKKEKLSDRKPLSEIWNGAGQ